MTNRKATTDVGRSVPRQSAGAARSVAGDDPARAVTSGACAGTNGAGGLVDRLRGAGYNGGFTALEDAVDRYVKGFLDRADRFR